MQETNRFKRATETNPIDDSEEFENIENQINNQIGKVTTNIGTGLNNLSNVRGSFNGRSKTQLS